MNVIPKKYPDRRRRFTAEQIRYFVDQLERSGMSATRFAREHDLSDSALLRWQRRLGQQPNRVLFKPTKPLPPMSFAEVPLDSMMGNASWALELVRPDGVIIRLRKDSPESWLHRVLQQGS